MIQYIQTKEHLLKVSQADLGPMQKGKYQEFLQKAKETGLEYPKLIIETELKKPSIYGVTIVIYPIAEFEWDEFSEGAMVKYTPNVHVVDGKKYTAMI